MNKFSGFAQTFRKVMTETATNANAVARKAKLGVATVFALGRGRSRPSRQALASLTEVLPPAQARELVAAHLRDETPEAMRAQLRIGWIHDRALPDAVQMTDGEPITASSSYRKRDIPTPIKPARARVISDSERASEEDLERLLKWMHERAKAFPSFRKWLWQTYDLMQ